MKALTLHHPHAMFIPLGVKSIETRSWATKYRGPLAIHASQRRPPMMHIPPLVRERGPEAEKHNHQTWLVIDTITDPAFEGSRPQGSRIPKRATTPTLFFPHSGPHGRPHKQGIPATEQGSAIYLPLGAVVATCELVDVVPIVGSKGHWEDRPHPCVVVGPTPVVPQDRLRFLTMDEYGLLHSLDVSDQSPYGDFTPGRFAWLLGDIKPLDPPVPAKGHQGLWEWDGG